MNSDKANHCIFYRISVKQKIVDFKTSFISNVHFAFTNLTILPLKFKNHFYLLHTIILLMSITSNAIFKSVYLYKHFDAAINIVWEY